MMKKYIITLMFLLSAVLLILPRPSRAEQSLVEHQIAAILMDEARGGGEVSMAYVADAIRNRMIEQQVKYNKRDLTYTDILFWPNAFEGAPKFKNKSSKALEDYWLKKESASLWNTALKLANQTVNNTLPKVARGANSFNKSHGEKNSIFRDEKTGHYFYNMELGGFKHNPSLMTDDADSTKFSESDYVQPPTGSSNQHYGDNEDGSREAGQCSFSTLQKVYMEDTDDAKMCWYCNVVIVLMNSFFQAAHKALPSSISLGKLILNLGFLVWLAYFILQQVASFSPITVGSMLQEILKMGFKVALAYVAVEKGGELIAYYFINPVLDLGLKYGLALFTGLAGTAL